MAALVTRIARRISSTVATFRADCRFSPRFGLYRMCADLGGRLGLRVPASTARAKKEQWIFDFLSETLSDVIRNHQNQSEEGQYQENAPIWVCWWTGEDTAPPLVKRCIKSIRENAGSHPVHLITQENYSAYLDIPPYILDKVSDGTMCVANFSDYLRFSLLAKYGGLWLDATIYCSVAIPEDYFRRPLFTCKGTLGDPSGYLSRYRWTSFCFGGYRGNVMFRYMQQAFDAYWQQHTSAIDYLLVDYLIDLAVRCLPNIKALLDGVPENNLHRDDLQAAMNAALPAAEFEKVLQPDTVLYKLSWRETYSPIAADGGESVYGGFLKKMVSSDS